LTNSFINPSSLAENKQLIKLQNDNDDLTAKVKKLTEENEVLKTAAEKEVSDVPAGDGTIQDSGGEKP
jgi:cell division protein FtsB